MEEEDESAPVFRNEYPLVSTSGLSGLNAQLYRRGDGLPPTLVAGKGKSVSFTDVTIPTIPCTSTGAAVTANYVGSTSGPPNIYGK
ncbi:MAG TPA: hypothetical protein VI636_09210 [Candidatus Angelobacter sp.]